METDSVRDCRCFGPGAVVSELFFHEVGHATLSAGGAPIALRLSALPQDAWMFLRVSLERAERDLGATTVTFRASRARKMTSRLEA